MTIGSHGSPRSSEGNQNLTYLDSSSAQESSSISNSGRFSLFEGVSSLNEAFRVMSHWAWYPWGFCAGQQLSSAVIVYFCAHAELLSMYGGKGLAAIRVSASRGRVSGPTNPLRIYVRSNARTPRQTWRIMEKVC